jgi:hypothetical protein
MDPAIDGFAVRQQLREELLARAWAVDSLDHGAADAGGHARIVGRLEATAGRWWALLCDVRPSARRETAAHLQRLLWPTFGPTAEWWSTPLGVALLAIRPELAPAPAAGPATARPRREPVRGRGTTALSVPDQVVLLPTAAATA